MKSLESPGTVATGRAADQRRQIDTLRGLACLALVVFHTVGADKNSGLRIADEHGLRLFNDVLAYVRMPLFSFLSGYVYALRPVSGSGLRFIKGKVRRLLVPMLLVGTLFAILQANVPGSNFNQYDWRLLHIVPVAHYWFLESLFIVFLVIVLLERANWLADDFLFAGVWLAAAALFAMDPFPRYFGLSGATYLFPFVLLGIACHRLLGRWPDAVALPWIGLVFVSVIGFTWGLASELPRTTSLVGLALGTCACLLLFRGRMESTLLAAIGTYSFAIFLFHSVFSAASRIVLEKLGQFPIPLLMACGIITALIGPIVVELVLRRSGLAIGAWMLGVKRSQPRTAIPPVNQ